MTYMIIMTMMIMMIIITFCALDILILEFLTCKWQLVWNMSIKFIVLLLSIILLFLLLFSIILLFFCFMSRVQCTCSFFGMEKWNICIVKVLSLRGQVIVRDSSFLSLITKEVTRMLDNWNAQNRMKEKK